MFIIKNDQTSTSKLCFFIISVFFSHKTLSQTVDLERVERFHPAVAEHCIQEEMIAIEDPFERFLEAFECGDELFATHFNAVDGVGANVGNGQRFTRVPRADQNRGEEWANHFPRRSTGPNAEACTTCHNIPFEDGAGLAGLNVSRDPTHSGNPRFFVNRNTPHVFALGALQLLAEEITTELQSRITAAQTALCDAGASAQLVSQSRNFRERRGESTRGDGRRSRDSSQDGNQSGNDNGVEIELIGKGISFGSVYVTCDRVDTRNVVGIDRDLVVKPFQWKGNTAFLRDFNRDASHNELGMQPVEITGDDFDGDGDGVSNEFGIGDISALTIYVAAQPRPVTKLELHALGIMQLSFAEIASINNGENIFEQVGCADCHRPALVVNNPVFSEPSQHPAYRDELFPAGQDPEFNLVSINDPIRFNLTTDQPSNILEINGTEVNIGNFEANAAGGAIVRLYGDLKRHNMGRALEESIDEEGIDRNLWMTKELWGVGSTAPYLHDGRATTLTEAILAHGGDARSSRQAAAALSDNDHEDLLAFLNNLILFKVEEE